MYNHIQSFKICRSNIRSCYEILTILPIASFTKNVLNFNSFICTFIMIGINTEIPYQAGGQLLDIYCHLYDDLRRLCTTHGY